MTDCEHPTYKSVMIHASAVEYRGKALVFLGPSETGKSTISQLLAATLDGARVLADDTVDLDWQAGSEWMVSDAKLRLSWERSGVQNVSFVPYTPLGAIFRLYQAPFPRLEPVRTLEIGQYLLSAFFEVNPHPRVSIEKRKLSFVSLSAIAKFVPGYEFYCDLSVQTVNLLRRETILA